MREPLKERNAQHPIHHRLIEEAEQKMSITNLSFREVSFQLVSELRYKGISVTWNGNCLLVRQ